MVESEDKINAVMNVVCNKLMWEYSNEFDKCRNENITASKTLQNRIESLLNKDERHRNLITALKTIRRIAVCVMSAIVAFILIGMCIRPLRENVINAIWTWYNDYIKVEYSSEKEDTENYLQKRVTYLPDGYKLKEEHVENDSYFAIFSNDSELLFYDENYSNNSVLNIDNTDVTKTEVYINGIKGVCVCYNKKDVYNILYWNEDGITYTISSLLPQDEMLLIAKGVK